MVSSNLRLKPARLNLRWLPNEPGPGHEQGQQQDIECNHNPALSPICGWLLRDSLGNTLAVYDAAGKALGSLNFAGRWYPHPGETGCSTVVLIPNPHLQRVVQSIAASSEASSQFCHAFVSALDRAQGSIVPESRAHHQSLRLLMGRPLAIVRVAVGLEIKGLCAINSDWDLSAEALPYGHQPHIDDDCIQDVQYLVRLGEHAQLNDGLVGFWRENSPKESLQAYFYSPKNDKQADSDVAPNRHLIHGSQDADTEKNLNLQLKLGDTAQMLSMLMDPRAKLHGSCSIAPSKVITIPTEHYADALQAIEVTFLSPPLLSPTNLWSEQREDPQGLSSPPPNEIQVPHEAGYAWDWREKEGGQWHNTPQIGQDKAQAKFSSDADLFEGWLELSKQNKKKSNSASSNSSKGK
jgi:hypothetical protein